MVILSTLLMICLCVMSIKTLELLLLSSPLFHDDGTKIRLCLCVTDNIRHDLINCGNMCQE